MTNRENMKKVIKNDFDKEKNYEKIIDVINKKKTRLNYKYAIIPITTIIIFVLIVGFSTKNNKIKQLEKFGGGDWYNETDKDYTTTTSNNNHFDTADSDSSSIIINEVNDMIKVRSNIKVVNNINIPYFDMLTNLEIPDDFDNKEDYRAVYVMNDIKSVKNDYILNNYEFHYKNTMNNREIVMSFSKNFMPINNYNFGVNNNVSVINGSDVELYKYKKIYIAKFKYKDYNFLIEVKSITQEEFTSFISSIIK